ncbi:MAG: hypothetical protein ACPGYY_00260 [Bacteroidia bacterium]
MSRDKVHSKIDELLGLLSIHNNRLSLHSERLSQLDIDVLRKQCIELYEEINKLALQGKIVSPEKVETPIVKQQKATHVVKTEVEVKVEEEPAANEEPAVEKIEKEGPKPQIQAEPEIEQVVEKKATPPKKKPKKEARAEEEMLSLFEKFSSKPIESIPRGISVAKRFEFQSEFFDGEAKEYKNFMNLLDSASDREAAFEVYHDYKNKRDWDNEDLKDELKALIYRKHTV